MKRLLVVASIVWPGVLGGAGCSGDHSYLDPDQGPCTGLDEDQCMADDRCQQSYTESGFSPGPAPLRCLQLEAVVHSETPCEGLSQGDCRTRAECSPIYTQDLGPNDGAVGDPYYGRCVDPSTLGL